MKMPLDGFSDDEDAVQVKTVWSKFNTSQQLSFDSEDEEDKTVEESSVQKKKSSTKQLVNQACKEMEQAGLGKENSGGFGYIERNVTPKPSTSSTNLLRQSSTSMHFEPIGGTPPHDETIEFAWSRHGSSNNVSNKKPDHQDHDHGGSYPLKRTYGCIDISIKAQDKSSD